MASDLGLHGLPMALLGGFQVRMGYIITKFTDIYRSKITSDTVITLNIGTPRPATVVVLYIKQFNFTLK